MKVPTDKSVCKTQLTEAIDEWIILSLYADRDRRIMYRRLVDGASIDDLCGEFRLEVSQIRRIVDKWADVIFEHIE